MQVFLLQGPPGVGKTTVAMTVVARDSSIEYFQVGDYLERALGDLVDDREEMRREAPRLITVDTIRSAISTLRADLMALRGRDVKVLLETRDVALRPYGLRGYPISVEIVKGLDCGGIFMLSAPATVVLARAAGRGGAQGVNGPPIFLEDYYTYQVAFSAATSIEIGCPLHLVEAQGSPESLASELIELMA